MNPEQAKRFLENGKKFLISGDTDEAERAFRNALRKGAAESDVAGYLELIQLLNGEYKTLIRAAAKAKPAGAFGYYTRFWLCYMRGDLDEAYAILNAMLESDRYYLRAFALKELWKRSGREHFDARIESSMKRFGLQYDMNLEEQRASVYLDLMQNRDNLALLQMKNLYRDYPNFPEILLDYLDLLGIVNQPELARELLWNPAVIEQIENDPRLQYLAAKVLYGIGEYEKSETLLNGLADTFRNNPVFHYNLANVSQKLVKTQKALEEYRETILVAPLFERAYFNLGTLYLGDGRLSEAHRALDRSIKIVKRSDAIYNFSVCLVESRRLEEAYHYLQNLSQFDEDYRIHALNIRERVRECVASATWSLSRFSNASD